MVTPRHQDEPPGRLSDQQEGERSHAPVSRQRGLLAAMAEADPLPEEDHMDPILELPAEPVEIG